MHGLEPRLGKRLKGRLMNKDDILALVELTWERLKVNEWSSLYTRRLETIPEVEIKNVQRGRAWWIRATGCVYKIIFPEFLFNKHDGYVIWYVIHELCHCIYHDHGSLFKKLESSLMGEWDITAEYSRAYPKRLYVNGEMVFEHWREKEKKKGYHSIHTARTYHICEECSWDITPGYWYYKHVKAGQKTKKYCMECGAKKFG
jgi:hypothetical protein